MGYLLVNPHSGNGGAEELSPPRPRAESRLGSFRDGEDEQELARAADAEALGMAGGDGSLAAVAAVAIERDLPFVCIPFGTRNHFARDAGITADDPAAALSAFTDGVEQRVDVGRLGDRLFLNNVSFGVYAHLVHRREHHRRRSEALARLRALGEVVRHRHEVGLSLDGRPVSARVVLVSNNAYDLDVLSLGERRRLDEGLCTCTRRPESFGQAGRSSPASG